jgi:hypothetical protein
MDTSIPQRHATIVTRGSRDEAIMECSSDLFDSAERAFADLSPRSNKVGLRVVSHDGLMEDEGGHFLQACEDRICA